ncbi:MAG TPA: hypothetical protein VEQ11_11415 [Chloroflexota bacterium]|nr:hypothetical protein [Chloroflexota bacterium]
MFKPIPDSNQRLTALRKDTLDIIEAVPPKDLARLKTESNLDVFELSGIGSVEPKAISRPR